MNSEPQQTGKTPVNLKRRMLVVLGIILAVLVLMFVLVTALENWLARKQVEQPIHGTPQTIIFHTPNYDEDITKDTSYMDLDRQIYYADPYTGVTVSLKSDSYWEHGDGVELLCHMIESIIAGNHEKYNRFFSDAYFDVEPEKEPFTPQKLYNITITLQSREEVTEEGMTYDREIYVVEYMIRQNNGTFRTDVGSDAIRKQLIVLTDREGEMRIDTVSSVTYSYS
jgi:hypothetical protein